MPKTNLKGEVRFKSGPAEYVFVLDFAAQDALEAKYDKRFLDVISEDLDEMRSAGIVHMLWLGLKRHHPEQTEEATREIYEALGVGYVLNDVIKPGVHGVLNVPMAKEAEASQARP